MTSSPTYDASYPSICIPRTFSTIGWQQVKTVFEVLFGIGSIERVDVVRKTAKDGCKFNCMFVHFVEWAADEVSQDVRQKLIDGKTIKIVYDEPWYWKCSMSRIRRPEKRYIDNKPYIASAGGTARARASASASGAATSPATARASASGAAAATASGAATAPASGAATAPASAAARPATASATNADIPPTLHLPHAVLRHNATAYDFKSSFME